MVPKEAVLVKAFKVQRGGETYFRVDLPKDRFPDGKRRSVVAKTRHEALEKADEKLQSSEHRVDPDAGAQTLETFLRVSWTSTRQKAAFLLRPGRTIAITLIVISFLQLDRCVWIAWSRAS